MRVLVFGASGTIGSAISEELSTNGIVVTSVSNKSTSTDIQTINGFDSLLNLGVQFDGCVWAQGINSNDTLLNSENFQGTLHANVMYIVESMRFLMQHDLLASDSSLVIVSSVWQQLTRKNKFSYSVSKAALEGLVNSVMADFSNTGLRINSDLPGVVDSKMTRENLTESQIRKIEMETPTQTLVTTQELARVVAWLLSRDSRGINGQFITVDNGWSHVRTI
jgi:NAD(P)-dependent dehydrogenase (short-subunit alcohol dehydrogenase family)